MKNLKNISLDLQNIRNWIEEKKVLNKYENKDELFCNLTTELINLIPIISKKYPNLTLSRISIYTLELRKTIEIYGKKELLKSKCYFKNNIELNIDFVLEYVSENTANICLLYEILNFEDNQNSSSYRLQFAPIV